MPSGDLPPDPSRPGEPARRRVRLCRYRTAALCGPWRRSGDEAIEDAIRAGQVRRDEGEPVWRVDGEIEWTWAP